MKAHRDAGVPGGVGVAADRESVAAQASVLEDHVYGESTEQKDPEHERDAEQIAFTEVRVALWDVVDGKSVGDDEREPADDPERAEGDDERVDPELRGEEAVDEAP